MKNFQIKILLAGLIISLVSCNQTQKTPAPEEVGLSGDTLALVTKKLQEYNDTGKLPCVSYMLIKNNKVIQREDLGYINMEEKVTNGEKTIFRIYSMTKPVTATALMILYDEGKFSLDDQVSKYIPEFGNTLVYTPGENGFTLEPPENGLTIRHLLTHTSGIVYGWTPDSYVDSLYRANNVPNWETPLEECMKRLAQMPLKFQPGTKWEYGLSIDVAGYLAEVLSGMPLDEFMKSRLFEPLKMVDTDFYVPEEKHDRLAWLYFRDAEGKLQKSGGGDFDMNEFFKKPVIHFSGGGGLVSTMDDYARFCLMLINGGELDGVRVLQDSTVSLILSDQLPEGASYREGTGYGLGGEVELESGVYGWAGAASTKFWIDPSSNMIIILMTQLMPFNTGYAYEIRDIVDAALIK